MARRLVGASLFSVLVVLLVLGCTAPEERRPGAGPVTSAPPVPITTPTTASVAGTGQAGGVFSVNAAQAREVAAVVEFLRAYNAGRVGEALGVLAADPRVSDCDYRTAENVEFHGRAAVTGWLRQRGADHDRLVVARIFDENPEQPVGVVGVEYQRRTSDTLRRLGFRAGIVPGAAKVTFTADQHIDRFIMGGGPGRCQPG